MYPVRKVFRKLARRGLFAFATFLVRHGVQIVIVGLSLFALMFFLPPPHWTVAILEQLPPPPTIPPYVPPTMVRAPVPIEAIPAGQQIDDLEGVIEMRLFVRAELTGKIVDPYELRHTLARHVLVRGQPISTDDVEPYVMLPVALEAQSAGTLIASDHANFILRAFAQSVKQDDKVLSLRALDNKLVVGPIPAGQPIPRASVDNYVVLPVLRFALARGALFESDNVYFKILPYQTVEKDLGSLVLDRADLLTPPKLVKGDNLAPDTPIKRDAVSP